MKTMKAFTVVMIVAIILPAAYAELENVQVGGSIEILGEYLDYAEDGATTGTVRQRTRLNVDADFTEEVRAFIEFDRFDYWGEGTFRSEWVTGEDFTDGSLVGLYQAYIEVNELWDTSLRLRIGRQELVFGNEWIMGDNSWEISGLSYDAIRLTYASDAFSLDAFYAKLNETFDDFGDSDTDLYGLYGSYALSEDITLDAYWIWVRDDGPVAGVVAGSTDADLHTVGARLAGTVGAFDFESEAAFQFGEIEMASHAHDFGKLEMPSHVDEADFDGWGLILEAGYTFDISYQPRIYAGFSILTGGDGGDLAFNRVFSDHEYGMFMDATDLTNIIVYSGGASVSATESIQLGISALYFEAEEAVVEGDDDLELEVRLWAEYQYSEDLMFYFAYTHAFVGDGVDDGNLTSLNGFLSLDDYLGIKGNQDWDYFYFMTEIYF